MSCINFHDDWTTDRVDKWIPLIRHLVGQRINVLEIGCYEGRTTSWLMENILTHEDSVMVCVDPFCVNADFADGAGELYPDYLPRFVENTARWREQIHILQTSSQILLPETVLNLVMGKFDFIYVDGAHGAEQVKRDAKLALAVAKPGALIAFDDYGWDTVGAGLNDWLSTRPYIHVVLDDYQLIVGVDA